MKKSTLRRIYEAHDYDRWDELVDRYTDVVNSVIKLGIHSVPILGLKFLDLANIVRGKDGGTSNSRTIK